MTKQLITLADLDESLIDVINGLQAQINRLGEIAHVEPGTLQTAKMEASARVQRARIEHERQRANREQLEEDRRLITQWAGSAQFIYENAEEWKKAAELEWKAIVERNGSEHEQSYLQTYREPNRQQLLDALREYERWENNETPRYAHARSNARRALPTIKKKLAAILSE